MNTLTVNITVPAPKVVPVPSGAPKATILNVGVADSSGRVCGQYTVEGADLTLGFEAGEQPNETMFEGPSGDGSWSENIELGAYLPAGMDEYAYVDYLRALITSADWAYREMAYAALRQVETSFLAALNGSRTHG